MAKGQMRSIKEKKKPKAEGKGKVVRLQAAVRQAVLAARDGGQEGQMIVPRPTTT